MSTSVGTSAPDLRYPIGRFQPPGSVGGSERTRWIEEIESLPRELRAAVAGLSEKQLDTSYRPDGWTIRQVVHHVADSHLNSYIRFRFALTEDTPTIMVYDEAVWAQLPDARSAPVEFSLELLDGLHGRWAALLRAMNDDEFARTFRHPKRGTATLEWWTGLYAWHGRHHVAHITGLREREGW